LEPTELQALPLCLGCATKASLAVFNNSFSWLFVPAICWAKKIAKQNRQVPCTELPTELPRTELPAPSYAIGLRISEDGEKMGLDLSDHAETAYTVS